MKRAGAVQRTRLTVEEERWFPVVMSTPVSITLAHGEQIIPPALLF